MFYFKVCVFSKIKIKYKGAIQRKMQIPLNFCDHVRLYNIFRLCTAHYHRNYGCWTEFTICMWIWLVFEYHLCITYIYSLHSLYLHYLRKTKLDICDCRNGSAHRSRPCTMFQNIHSFVQYSHKAVNIIPLQSFCGPTEIHLNKWFSTFFYFFLLNNINKSIKDRR